MDDRVEV